MVFPFGLLLDLTSPYTTGGICFELSSGLIISVLMPALDIISDTNSAHLIIVGCFFAETLGTLISCCSCDKSTSISESTLDAIIVKLA